jgi:hypothetical protein
MSQSHSLFEAYQAVYTPQEQDDYQLVLDYLVSEGYVDDADEAELVIEQLEDDVIDGILDEVKGCGGKVNPDNGDYENGSGSARMMLSPRKKALAMARRKENEATTPQHQRQAAKMRRVASNMKEELDTYDLVLDYLLSEGFADNEEAALQIMSNMSEEWREEILDEANRAERELELTGSERAKARSLNMSLTGPTFYRKGAKSALKDKSDPVINKAVKRMSSKRSEEHKIGRYLRGDTGPQGGVIRPRYQANKDHVDGYPSIRFKG